MRTFKLLAVLSCAVLIGSVLTQVVRADDESEPTVEERLDQIEEMADDAALAGHNAWMLTSCALVLFMTAPGLALFYSGLVRKKNDGKERLVVAPLGVTASHSPSHRAIAGIANHSRFVRQRDDMIEHHRNIAAEGFLDGDRPTLPEKAIDCEPRFAIARYSR